MKLISCDESYAPQILAIFNDAILNSTAIYDYQPRTAGFMAKWFQSKTEADFPVIGFIDESDGSLLGFGSYGHFRTAPAYKYTIEHSLYIRRDRRGQGLGRLLLQELIGRAQTQEYHVMIGAIDSQNAGSIALHRKFGFAHAGRITQAGFKFNQWLDLDFYQLTLSTPANPKPD